MQIHQIGILKKLGFRVEVFDSKAQVDAFVEGVVRNAIHTA